MAWSYMKCERVWATVRWPERGKPLNWGSMRMFKVGQDFHFRHHSTVTVRIHPDNTRTITPQGWDSVTTKKNIDEYGGVRLTSRAYKINAEPGMYVWSNNRYHLFEEGDRFTEYGEPLVYRPYKVLRLRKDGCTKPFGQMCKRLIPVLLPRMMVGEFQREMQEEQDQFARIGKGRTRYGTREAINPEDLLDILEEIDESIQKGNQWIDPEKASVLFRPRPAMCFGRVQHNWRAPTEARLLLQSNLNAARRAYYERNDCYEWVYPDTEK